jgi:hypothetical protein
MLQYRMGVASMVPPILFCPNPPFTTRIIKIALGFTHPP